MTHQKKDDDCRPELVALGRLIAAFLLLWSVFPFNASACTCRREIGAGMLYLGRGASLPGDAVGIPWSGVAELERSQVSLKRISIGKSEETKFAIEHADGVSLIVPRNKIVPNEKYEITIREENWKRNAQMRRQNPTEAFPAAEITAIITILDDAITLHDITLQATNIQKTVQIATGSSCTDSASVRGVDIKVLLPPDLEPYREYFLYETFVDGQVWTPRHHVCDSIPAGRSWLPEAGTNVIYADCDGLNAGMTTGRHYIDVAVYVPGKKADTLIVRQEVSLNCKLSNDEVQETKVADSADFKGAHPNVYVPVSNHLSGGGYEDKPPPSGESGCQVDAPPGNSYLSLFMLVVLCSRRHLSRIM